MTRFALISDLHFGRVDDALVPTLLEAIHTARPDGVLIAGDFVQRARAAHFRPARAFVDALEVPWYAVPGNHDIPLFNLFKRLISPRAAYRHWISEQTEPTLETPDALIIGLDTTDPLRHQRGRVTDADISRIGEMIAQSGDRTPVILAHHPFHHSEDVEKRLMQGAPAALEAWADCGPHVILSGHLHTFLAEPFLARKGLGMTLQVHCGSSTSTRHRGNPNDLAILDLGKGEVRITRLTYKRGEGFSEMGRFAFVASPEGWSVPAEDPTVVAG